MSLYIAYLIFVKAVTVSVIYCFIQVILEGSSQMIWLFGVLYALERWICFCLVSAMIQIDQIRSWLSYFLYPVHLEFLLYLFLVPKQNFQQVDRQEFFLVSGLIISFLSIPLYILIFYWTYTITAAGTTDSQISLFPCQLTLLQFMLISILFWFSVFISSKRDLRQSQRSSSSTITTSPSQSQKAQSMYAREGLLASLHFLTYASLMYWNYNLDPAFTYYWITFQAIMAPLFMREIYRISKSRNPQPLDQLFISFFCAFVYSKQLCHVDIDPRSLSDEYYYGPIKNCRLKVFDRMIQFSLIYKIFLFAVFIRNQFSSTSPEGIEASISATHSTILIIGSVASILILAIRFFIYLKYTCILEITSKEQLNKLISLDLQLKLKGKEQKNENQGQQHQLQKLCDNIPRIFPQLKLTIIRLQELELSKVERFELLLNHFEGSEIRFVPSFPKQHRLCLQQSEYDRMSVRIPSNSNYQEISKIISCNRMNPSIQEFEVEVNSSQEEKGVFTMIISLMKANISLKIRNSNTRFVSQLLLEHNKYIQTIETKIIEYVAFSEQIAPFQLFNLNQIFFDLYEDILF